MHYPSSTPDKNNPLKQAIDSCMLAFKITFWFAFISNLLMLITPLYSLQVLDRVIGSGNLNTLLMLSLVIAITYFTHALLQISRSFTLIKIGEWLDKKLSPIIFNYSVAYAAQGNASANQMLRDFQAVKTFLTSTGINTIFDAPWTIVYIIVIFLIHPYIGYITIIGSVVIVGFAFFNAVATNKTLNEATEQSIKSMTQAEIANRNAEAVEAMGMSRQVAKNWAQFNNASLNKQSIASYRNGIISNISRFIRNIIQMAVTGVGAYVVVKTSGQDMTTGGMIASSIIVGRALAPFDNAIGMWKSISSTMKSYKNLNDFFIKFQLRDQAMPIPEVAGYLSLENVCYVAKSGAAGPALIPKYILKELSFAINPGEILAIIGPSAAGKSTLAKLIVGVWSASSGSIRLDGGDVFTWNRENFGGHVGYLPQGIELFSGTIKQNIARMNDDCDPKQVIATAKMCGAHEMILHLQDGYDTDIGSGGSNLSGGQRQRIGLARAFYGNPKLVVLDEPNANLDEAGEIALAGALAEARERKITVVVISHRPSILSAVDKILILQNGTITSFGTKEEVYSHIEALKSGMIHIK